MVSALVVKEMRSVPYCVRFFICNVGMAIAMPHCVVRVNIVINVMCSAALVMKSKMDSTPQKTKR